MKTRLDEMRQIKSIGDVSDLTTDNKENVVVAINEIKSDTDSKIGCKNYDGSSGVNVPPISSGIGGTGITPVGLQFKWVGSELGIKRENAYEYIFSDLKGEKGEQGKDGTPGPRGDRGAKGNDGFPSKKDWQSLLQRVKAIESMNDIHYNYEQSEMTYISNILTASNRTVNINYGSFARSSIIKHELSEDGGVTFKTVTSSEQNGFYSITKSFSSHNIGDEIQCMLRLTTSSGEYVYSNLFVITISDSTNLSDLEFNLAVDTLEIFDDESIMIGFECNKNIHAISLSINGGEYYHRGSIHGDRVTFNTGNMIPGNYSCRLKVETFTNSKIASTIETNSFNVTVIKDYERLPQGDTIKLLSLEPRKHIDELGNVDKRSLTFRFNVKHSNVNEVRCFYYSVDGSSFEPIENVRYIGNGFYDATISWAFDPFANRRLQVMCSRLKKQSSHNNSSVIIKDFIQNYNADMINSDVES